MGRASNRLDIRGADKGADQGLRDFRFNQLRAARPLHIDDDLRIRNVGDGVQRRFDYRVDAQAPASRTRNRTATRNRMMNRMILASMD